MKSQVNWRREKNAAWHRFERPGVALRRLLILVVRSLVSRKTSEERWNACYPLKSSVDGSLECHWGLIEESCSGGIEKHFQPRRLLRSNLWRWFPRQRRCSVVARLEDNLACPWGKLLRLSGEEAKTGVEGVCCGQMGIQRTGSNMTMVNSRIGLVCLHPSLCLCRCLLISPPLASLSVLSLSLQFA